MMMMMFMVMVRIAMAFLACDDTSEYMLLLSRESMLVVFHWSCLIWRGNDALVIFDDDGDDGDDDDDE